MNETKNTNIRILVHRPARHHYIATVCVLCEPNDSCEYGTLGSYIQSDTGSTTGAPLVAFADNGNSGAASQLFLIIGIISGMLK